MGKGGVSPDYFLHHMQWWEMQPYIDGLNMRDRAQFESSRLVAHTVACMFCKSIPKSQSEWMPFSWEQENGDDDPPTQVDDSYIREMQEAIRRENEALNQSTAE